MADGDQQIPGGGQQGERLEGSLTDGGSLPGPGHDEDRSFGAGRGLEPGAPEGGEARPDEGAAADPKPAPAGPSGEHSGYGNTPPRS